MSPTEAERLAMVEAILPRIDSWLENASIKLDCLVRDQESVKVRLQTVEGYCENLRENAARLTTAVIVALITITLPLIVSGVIVIARHILKQ